MKRICVFCGSSPGQGSQYREAAEKLGRVLVKRDLGLVYGGGKVGLMGRLAESVLNAGGDVVGVIPAALAEKEVALRSLPDLRIVASMHERKALMAELADGFIALPGGLGTLEEMLEVLTWAQLGIHEKPCGILDVDGYFAPLTTFLEQAVCEGFVRAEHRGLLLRAEDPAQLLDLFAAHRPVQLDKASWALSLEDS